MKKYNYSVVRSQRKSISIQIKQSGEIVVRVPQQISDSEVQEFVAQKQNWIDKHLNLLQSQVNIKPLDEQELHCLAEKAMTSIPIRVQRFAKLAGVDYGKITIRNQKSRWGSCSSKGNLNFNCLLMLLPDKVIDSVVAHEVCHRKHMNHSSAFYAELYRIFPEYDECHKWLKENGGVYLRRLR